MRLVAESSGGNDPLGDQARFQEDKVVNRVGGYLEEVLRFVEVTHVSTMRNLQPETLWIDIPVKMKETI